MNLDKNQIGQFNAYIFSAGAALLSFRGLIALLATTTAWNPDFPIFLASMSMLAVVVSFFLGALRGVLTSTLGLKVKSKEGQSPVSSSAPVVLTSWVGALLLLIASSVLELPSLLEISVALVWLVGLSLLISTISRSLYLSRMKPIYGWSDISMTFMLVFLILSINMHGFLVLSQNLTI